MNAKRRVLVAGIGNVFFRDDGFGVAVARRLAEDSLPAGARVADFGIRGVHLAFELLDAPDLLILVDAMARGGAPGTLYIVDPEVDSAPHAVADAHAMSPGAVFAALRGMGGTVPKARVVGCEPEDVREGMDLSLSVARAVEPAAALVRRLVEEEVKS